MMAKTLNLFIIFTAFFLISCCVDSGVKSTTQEHVNQQREDIRQNATTEAEVLEEYIDYERYCETDVDCACGVHYKTGACFYGNRRYVNVSRQCPDFCSGIKGDLRIGCVKNQCVQQRVSGCVTEGGRISVKENRSCCSGLVMISDVKLTPARECFINQSIGFICARCGDEVCGLGENVCNCPIDCAKGLDALRSKAVDYVMNTSMYKQLGGVNLTEKYFRYLGEGLYELIYAYNTSDNRTAGRVQSVQVRMSFKEGELVSTSVKTVYRLGNIKDFCGVSTEGSCSTDRDCVTAGCGGEVCKSKDEEYVSDDHCIQRECFNAFNYGLDCQCINGRCMWHK